MCTSNNALAQPHFRTCTSSGFRPVVPTPNPQEKTPIACTDDRLVWNRQACSIARGYSKFIAFESPSTKQTIYGIEETQLNHEQYRRFLKPLDDSKAIREVIELRAEARKLSGHANPCEPTPIYFGDHTVFGLGPAFVSGTTFSLSKSDGSSETIRDLIVAEDAVAPIPVPIKMISKEGLRQGDYYDIVIAHELAHGLMQDLYGVEPFAQLEKRAVTRDGHFASAVTDPITAWVEGFAEGFEAYLAEKYSTDRSTPTLDALVRNIHKQTDLFSSYGVPSYFVTIPSAVFRTSGLIMNLDAFVTDFLKAERIDPIIENRYVFQGPMVNLAHKYEIAPNAQADWQPLLDGAVEPTDAIYSKEGAIAHFVYRLLKAGHAQTLIEIIHTAKPENIREFVQAMPPSLVSQPEVAEALVAVFTQEGRQITAQFLKSGATREERSKKFNVQMKAAIETFLSKDFRLAAPKDLWVEFWNASLIRQKLYGRMDRINLLTAPPSRLQAFVESIVASPKDREYLLKSWLYLRENESTKIRNTQTWVTRWNNLAEAAKVPAATREKIAERVLAARACYVDGCLSR